jgi:membrane protein YdbS with pleckstrin-like domain
VADYIDSLLADGEHVLIRGRQHWIALIDHALRPIVILLVAVGLWTLGQWFNPDGLLDILDRLLTWVTVAAFVLGIIWFPISAARWLARRYVLTDRRTIRVEGLVNKHSFDSQLEKINDVIYEQSALGRMLGYGDLDVDTAASEELVEFPMLRDAVGFKKELMEAKHRLGDAEYRHVDTSPPISVPPQPAMATATTVAAPVPAAIPAAPPPVAPTLPSAQATSADEVTAALASLAALRDRGAITADEYEAKKQELLGRI